MFKRLLINLLLGNKKEFSQLISIRGSMYLVSIQKHETADDFIRKMKEALREQGLKKL